MNRSSIFSSDNRQQHNACLRCFLGVALGPFILGVLLVQVFLYPSGENWAIAEVIDTQHSLMREGQESLFKRMFVAEDLRRYKLHALLSKEPVILALGSSTVMQFRGKLFSDDPNYFYNAGGLIHEASQLEEALPILESQPSIKLMIVGLDLWWFNENRQIREMSTLQDMRDGPSWIADWQARLYAYRPVAGMLVDWSKLQEALAALWPLFDNVSTFYEYRTIGLMARKGSGWRGSDGSYQYGWHIARSLKGLGYVDDRGTLDRIRRGGDRFEPSHRISRDRIVPLETLLQWSRQHDVLVCGFLPPLAPEVIEALNRSEMHSGYLEDYQYEMKQLFSAYDMPFVNALDPADFQLDIRYHYCPVKL
jgi:hypothetical protein